MMARRVSAVLPPLLLLAACLLFHFQVSGCSRPLPSAVPAEAEPGSVETANDGGTGLHGAGRREESPAASMSSSPAARDDGDGQGSGREPPMLRSELARRFLVAEEKEEGSVTDGAGASCGSYHKGCPPALKP